METTSRKGDTKRQHYVPKFILRKFSRDGSQLSLFAYRAGKRIDNVSLRNQCYEDYFYGADNVIEKGLGNQEDKVAAVLGDLSVDRLGALDEEGIGLLRTFLRYQHARTRGAAEHLSNFAGAFAKETYRELSRTKDLGISTEQLDEMELGIEDAQAHSMWEAAKSLPAFLDLTVKFVVTDRSPGFALGDHPVATYNQFVEHHPVLRHWPASNGLALKGLQLFFPLSPSVVLALFDPSTYEYGGRGLVCRAGPKDVAALNQMQSVSALSCLYFHPDRLDDAGLAEVNAARSAHPSPYTKRSFSRTVRTEEGERRLVMTVHPDIRLGAKLSFIRTTDGRSYVDHDAAFLPARSPELIENLRRYAALLEGKVRGRGR